jgi:hypothetical protein
MMIRLLLSCSLVLAACGDDGTSGDDDDDVTVDASTNPGDPDAFVPPGDSFTVDWGPVNANPGEEDTRCVVKKLGNTTELRTHQIHNVLGDASHHLIVYRVNDTTEQPEPFACEPFVETLSPDSGAPLMITQKAEETLTLPDGVAFVMQPDQMVRLELHYINATDSAIDVTASSTFVPIPDGEFTDEADLMFMGDVDIEIPANSTATLGPSYIPMPAELVGSKFFAITGHEHQWGTDVVVDTAMNQTTVIDTVYDVANFNWDEPETTRYDPPFAAPDGGGFRITCSWDNQSSSTVSFGESANQEMCFFWAYYYPSKGAKVCFKHFSSGLSGCCPGDAVCGFL